ncbi:adenylate cyclase [Rhodococcus opacus PD630]|uniref:adenylate/guanylate cyclase domain-containing protein n=1 Tax=Rhodococcus TaxID=1827 RepID=UPI00029CCD38|nr:MULTISPECIES: adenylate/guanylate cyclase domain-containing protein [Rhodococcus]KXF50811.1 cyclase [Rhodococcus sp. SC4]NDV05604.1 adenylate/guanylate cyclase domain-containing protein [Rhodococcus sp. IEGM 248]RZK86086.1 MAG: adenylate/guanylate cyclase domain-containing protein [Rhodococcus sp. (in: high G+C Gram-positive bacteria)]EHI40754.1 adenylate cyclase [Rhodococcus opacus PD630]KXX60512.1 cyclase [Rhodococcus sp. LB1]
MRIPRQPRRITPRTGRLVSPPPRPLRRPGPPPTQLHEFEAAGLLDGLSGSDRSARMGVLNTLIEDGVSIDELRVASRDDRLAHLLLEHALSPKGRYGIDEISRKAGVTVEDTRRWFRAIGRGASEDGTFYDDGDLDLARGLKQYRDLGLDESGIFAAARVLGRNLWTVADAADALLQERLEATRDHPEVALRYAVEVRRIADFEAQILAHLIATTLRHQLRSDAVGIARDSNLQVRGAQEIGVCFADLVGFTLLGEQVAPADLGRVAERLDGLATDLALAPVRLVKTIGDAVMLVSPDPNALAYTALDLVQAARTEGLPPLRAGIAWGTAVPSAGDWFGRPVNMASRVVAVAPSHEVVVTGEFYDELDTDEFWGEPAGSHRLKGIDAPQELFGIGRRSVA